MNQEFAASFDDEDAIRLPETYRDLAMTADHDTVREVFAQIGLSNLADRARFHGLFRRPIVMLVYWLLKHHPDEAIRRWPLPKYEREIESIAADLGIAS